jgi:hypothetical protein
MSERDTAIVLTCRYPKTACACPLYVAAGQHIREKFQAAVLAIARSFFDPKDHRRRMLGDSMAPKRQQKGDQVISPRRFAITATAVCGTVFLVGGAIAAVGFGLIDVRNTDATQIKDRAGEISEAGLSNAVAVSAVAAETVIAEAALPDASRTPTPETQPLRVAAATASGPVHADAEEAANSAETVNETSPDASPTIGPAAAPVQIATASAADLLRGDAKEAASSSATLDEPLPDLSPTLAPQAPPDGKGAATSTETLDECQARDICIDQYLWSVYQRAPKQDTVKMVERRKVTVKVDGKPRTVTKEFTMLVDEDFTWKDPKAAEKANMSLMEYVIGGMDHGFKLKLYHALHAMDDAGLSPGITSAFRDDYRQSLASGLKAATDRSYHGGSFRGGYGHGLAADLVSVRGETRAERLTSSESLWKWIDAHGKEFGIGRPYLDKDPAHVAPTDGKEYAAHRRGANAQQARLEIKKRNLLAVRDDHSVAKLAKTARSSSF